MQLLYSGYTRLGAVRLPPFQGRQKYMHSFDLANPKMEAGFEDYLEPVKALCWKAGEDYGIAHMTVDEKIVQAGMSQRKPRPHVDGCFIPAAMSWAHPVPGWNHYCNNVPINRMPIIVASSVAGCRVWQGVFEGQPKEDGDLSHIASQLGEGLVLPANQGFMLTPDCVHESMTFDRAVKRTFLRIALPVR